MPGTPAGGKKAAANMIARDPQHFEKIGRKGGIARGNNATKGFAHPDRRHLAEEWGRIGGQTSRRPKN